MAHKLIQEYAKSLKGNPVFTVRGPISPFLMMIPWRRLKDHPLPIFCINKGRDSLMAIDEKEYFAIAIDRFSQYREGAISLRFLKEEYAAHATEVQTLYDEVMSLSLEKLSEAKLVEYMKKISRIFDDCAEKTLYIETIDQEKMLVVMGQHKKELLDSIWESATHPTFVSFEGRRQRFLVDLVVSGDLCAVSKARFIYTDYIWTRNDIEIQTALDDIREHIEEKSKECEKLEKEAKKRKVEHDVWKKGLDKDTQTVVEYMQLVMLLRDTRKDVLGQILAVLIRFATEFFSRAEIDIKYAPFVLIYEYMKGVGHLKSIRKDIEKRSGGFMGLVRIDASYGTELCDFDKALHEFNEKIFTHDVHVKSIKGQIANKGNVTGRVRIVLDPHHQEMFEKGDILVASMTRPEFVPLMKKAGAVVTNEGGITCHAAIVSRELKIPCIIGTKIATRVLKEGDIVEVDANEGIVRIIS